MGPVATAAQTREPDTADRICGGYFAFQGVVGILLWITLGLSPTARSWFELVPERHAVVDAFGVADIVVIVTASFVAAWASATAKPWAVVPAAFTAGAVLYPTIYLIAWVNMTAGVGATGLAVMIAPALLSIWVTRQVWKQSH